MTREEAIETIRRCCPRVGDSQCDFETAMRELVPELAESEDERIRKWIYHYISNCPNENFEFYGGVGKDAVLVYLEKQKDASKAIEAVERIDKYIDGHLANAHDMKDSNPDKKYYRGWDDALGKMAGILQDVYSGEKQKEQNLGKYAEEDNLAYRLNWVMQDYIKAGKDEEEQEHRVKCYKLFWDALEDSMFFEQKEQKPDKVSVSEELYEHVRNACACLDDMPEDHKYSGYYKQAHYDLERALKMMEEEQKPEEDFYPEKLEDAIKSYYDTYGNGNWGFDHLSYSRFKDIVETFVKEYGQKPVMTQWTGKNLKEVIDFTGKSPRFNEWFKSWEEFEDYVHSHDDILKLFCEDGSHYEVPVGAWIVKTPDGYNIPSRFRFVQKLTDWSYPYGKNETVDQLIAIAECLEMDGDCSFNGYKGKDCGKFLRELARRESENKPAEWKLPDDFKTAVRNVTNFISPFSDPNDFNRVVDRFAEQLFELAKKEVNKPAEWSKEDKEMIELLSGLLDYEKKFCKKSQAGAAVMRQYEEAKKWLKSLRPHWKPSEEQMRYLKKAILYCIQDGNEKTANVIKELYEDLKKL